MQHHRMGSYFDPSSMTLKSILSQQQQQQHPPTPPPTSSIPSIKRSTALGSGAPAPPFHHRRQQQREEEDIQQIHALNRRLASLSIADMSPKLALQRVLLLYERGDHREAAAFLRRISQPSFKQLVSELPVDRFLDSMPQSMPVLEALYAKLYQSKDVSSRIDFSAEVVVWRIVHFFASSNKGDKDKKVELCGPWVSTCKRLLSVLLSAEPRVYRVVMERRKALTKAIEGLGQHGFLGGDDKELLSLHEALKRQFAASHKSYGDMMHRLESLGEKSSKALPVAQSHQRQLSLTAEQIQERLIRNRKLLNAVEPALDSQSLEVLLGILQRRIELDKECLFQFTQIKRDGKMTMQQKDKSGGSVAPVLMRCQKGCQQVLDLMREVTEERGYDDWQNDRSAAVSSRRGDIEGGYHSDNSDSTVMMSGNSPFISKSAKYNFLQRSIRSGCKHNSGGNLRGAVSAENLRYTSNNTNSSTNHVNSSVGGGGGGGGGGGNSRIYFVSSSSDCHSSVVNHPVLQQQQHNSSSGVSSNCSSSSNSSLTSPPETDDSSSSSSSGCTQEDDTNAGRSIVRVGPDGSASVIINCGMLVAKQQQQQLLRGRKMRKDIKAISIGDLSQRCAKCDRPSDSIKYHGPKCSRASWDEVARLRHEVRHLNNDLEVARKTAQMLQQQQQHDIVSEQQMDKRPAKLVRQFGELYSIARLDTLDDLDRLQELKDATELKNKLLFSVVVLSFRAASNTLDRLREQVKRLLQLPMQQYGNINNVAAREMEAALNAYLRRASETFDLTKNNEEVTTQIWATLYDYPCLKRSAGLAKYVDNCVRISWGLVNQVPQYSIEYDSRVFCMDLHVRNHQSDSSSNSVKTYLWPALREGKEGPCVHKAVVVT